MLTWERLLQALACRFSGEYDNCDTLTIIIKKNGKLKTRIQCPIKEKS